LGGSDYCTTITGKASGVHLPCETPEGFIFGIWTVLFTNPFLNESGSVNTFQFQGTIRYPILTRILQRSQKYVDHFMEFVNLNLVAFVFFYFHIRVQLFDYCSCFIASYSCRVRVSIKKYIYIYKFYTYTHTHRHYIYTLYVIYTCLYIYVLFYT
jgi:hypothetical protein